MSWGKSRRKRRVRRYTSCPECGVSLRVEESGRICRHSYGFGSVEKVGPGTRHPRMRTTICAGSGKLVEENLTKKEPG